MLNAGVAGRFIGSTRRRETGYAVGRWTGHTFQLLSRIERLWAKRFERTGANLGRGEPPPLEARAASLSQLAF